MWNHQKTYCVWEVLNKRKTLSWTSVSYHAASIGKCQYYHTIYLFIDF